MLNRTSIHDASINETTFESIVVFLTHEIINRKCIFPKKTAFIDATLTLFGNQTHLNETGFKALFNALNLGKDEATEEHGHQHEDGSPHKRKRRRRSIDHDNHDNHDNQDIVKTDVDMVRFLG